VDAMLCSVQEGTQESSAMRSHSLRVRLGMVTEVANNDRVLHTREAPKIERLGPVEARQAAIRSSAVFNSPHVFANILLS